MSLKAEQHQAIASSYEAAAADLAIPADRREEFARKAAWFRDLARLEAKREESGHTPDGSLVPEPEDRRKDLGMKHVMVALWLTGGALYLAATLLFSDAVNLAGREDRARPSSDEVSVAPSPKQPQHADPVADRNPQHSEPQETTLAAPAPDRPHAISPDQPASEPPLTATAPGTAPTAAVAPTAEPARITRKLKSAANIRSGPSMSAEIIGSARAGAELEVTAHESDWVQFVDPNSGNGGWIHSAAIESNIESGNVDDAALAAADPVEELPQVEPAKPKAEESGKARGKTGVGSKRQHPIERMPKAYVELPPDADFLPDERRGRLGLLERRRMLREGLMSPDSYHRGKPQAPRGDDGSRSPSGLQEPASGSRYRAKISPFFRPTMARSLC